MTTLQCWLCPCLDQNLNLAVMSLIRSLERAHSYLVRRHPGLHQCATNGSRAAVAQIIPGAVDCDLKRWILHQISGDFGGSAHLGGPNARPQRIEIELPIGGPTDDHTDPARGADRSRHALRTLVAGRPNVAGDAARCSALLPGPSAPALYPGGTRITGPAGGTNQGRALRTRVPRTALRAGGAWRTSWTGGTGEARPLSADGANITGGAGLTYRTCLSASASDDGTRSARRSGVALRARRTYGPDRTRRAAQDRARLAHRTCRTLHAWRAGWPGEAPGADKIGLVVCDWARLWSGAGGNGHRNRCKKHCASHRVTSLWLTCLVCSATADLCSLTESLRPRWKRSPRHLGAVRKCAYRGRINGGRIGIYSGRHPITPGH
jgi:hypothetical protein